MRKIISLYIGALFLTIQALSAQEYLLNQSQNLQMINPSYYGFNSLTKAGVIYNNFLFFKNLGFAQNLGFRLEREHGHRHLKMIPRIQCMLWTTIPNFILIAA